MCSISLVARGLVRPKGTGARGHKPVKSHASTRPVSDSLSAVFVGRHRVRLPFGVRRDGPETALLHQRFRTSPANEGLESYWLLVGRPGPHTHLLLLLRKAACASSDLHGRAWEEPEPGPLDAVCPTRRF